MAQRDVPMTDSRVRYRASSSEASMERTLREAVEFLGGMCFSVRDSRRLNVEHMPDLICIVPARAGRPGMVALIELKSQRRQITPGQRRVLDMLAACTELITGVVRPNPYVGEWSLDEVLSLIQGSEGSDGER